MSSDASVFGQLFGYLCVGGLVLVFVGLGIFLLVRSRRDKEKAAQSLNWPSVSGKVIDARMLESTSTDSDGDSSTTYRAHVQYEYEVAGTRYTNDKINVGMVVSTSATKKVQETLARYPAGATVKVYYDPNNPSDSVLEQKASSNLTLILGIIFLGVGLCMVLPIGIILLVGIATGG